MKSISYPGSIITNGFFHVNGHDEQIIWGLFVRDDEIDFISGRIKGIHAGNSRALAAGALLHRPCLNGRNIDGKGHLLYIFCQDVDVPDGLSGPEMPGQTKAVCDRSADQISFIMKGC